LRGGKKYLPIAKEVQQKEKEVNSSEESNKVNQ
jgi:hypothetical protein